MKLVLRPPVFHVLLYCAAQSLGVRIQSVPEVGSDGFIQTELEKAVSLVCQHDGGPGAQASEELVWLRNGAAVVLKDGNKMGSSGVCVTPVIHEDNDAVFTCHLRSNATLRASVTLNVTYAPTLSGSEEVAIEVEAALALQCDTFANPPVTSVLWTLNGSAVQLLEGGFTVANDGVTSRLTTGSADRSLHEGRYQCTVVSPLATRSKVFQVTVTDKTMKFPLMPIVAGVVVLCLTTILALVSRWRRIIQCCK